MVGDCATMPKAWTIWSAARVASRAFDCNLSRPQSLTARVSSTEQACITVARRYADRVHGRAARPIARRTRLAAMSKTFSSNRRTRLGPIAVVMGSSGANGRESIAPEWRETQSRRVPQSGSGISCTACVNNLSSTSGGDSPCQSPLPRCRACSQSALLTRCRRTCWSSVGPIPV
jgi:hypothetical protein